jgi:hypothetical protein
MSRRNKPVVTPSVETSTERFLHSARLGRARDLKQLSVLSDLVNGISELIHALQKERGVASIFLGSDGAQFADRLLARAVESRSLEEQVRSQIAQLDGRLGPMSCSTRFYTRVAFALRALDSLPGVREQVSALALAPQDAVKTFTELIAQLLAVGFETADIAADPETSRALVALVNFAQGKEYAGQERATAGAALSRGQLSDTDRRHLRHLESAQQRAFKMFGEFAHPRQLAAFLELSSSPKTGDYNRMRAALEPGSGSEPDATAADTWYEVTTRRIDAMSAIQDSMAAELRQLCANKLAEATAGARRVDLAEPDDLPLTVSVAMLVAGIYPANDDLPKPMRSILDVVEAQARRIDDINSQLQSARVTLAERKTVERAKGILMRSRSLSEQDAYTFLRQTAMGQNKRIFEVAEAVISVADVL